MRLCGATPRRPTRAAASSGTELAPFPGQWWLGWLRGLGLAVSARRSGRRNAADRRNDGDHDGRQFRVTAATVARRRGVRHGDGAGRSGRSKPSRRPGEAGRREVRATGDREPSQIGAF